jgi:hypothetical protein
LGNFQLALTTGDDGTAALACSPNAQAARRLRRARQTPVYVRRARAAPLGLFAAARARVTPTWTATVGFLDCVERSFRAELEARLFVFIEPDRCISTVPKCGTKILEQLQLVPDAGPIQRTM